MISPVACLECGKPFRVDKLANCPSCGVINVRLNQPAQARTQAPINNVTQAPAATSYMPPSTNSDRSNSELIAAQNRTTHAVRSLAITFVLAPVISVFVSIAFFLALRSENTGIIVFAGIVGFYIQPAKASRLSIGHFRAPLRQGGALQRH